jgi:hypothetical protein
VREVRDRQVLRLVGLLVAAVLLAGVISALVPGLDGFLATVPLVIVLLVVGTVGVLARAMWRQGRR